MEKIRKETNSEYLLRLARAAESLTPEQVDACAWVFGGSGFHWTSQDIVRALKKDSAVAETLDAKNSGKA